jgi:hypothetical protein
LRVILTLIKSGERLAGRETPIALMLIPKKIFGFICCHEWTDLPSPGFVIAPGKLSKQIRIIAH